MHKQYWPRIRRIDDHAGKVAKFVFENDTAVAEAVLYRYPDYKTRTVICISTQSGCPIGCRFCGAGDHFVRSLSPEEIVTQARYCLEQTDCDPAEMRRLQIMFMSMGEPLLNLKNLDPAIRKLYRLYPNAALLISTSAPDVDYGPLAALSVAVPTVGLQFSVHESTDVARNALIPFKRKLSLRQMAAEGLAWHSVTGRHPFFNYCAHDGNTSEEDAERLAIQFRPDVFCATVSVICERNEGMPASNDYQRELAIDFGQKLLHHGFDVRVFDPAGQDTIGGGCGQLHFIQQWLSDHPDLAKASIGNGLAEVHTPGAAI
jgi:23S rRNA (adenine2503-C2)-methyltransferase